MHWEKMDGGRTVGDVWVEGQYLYVSTDDGVYRLLISELPEVTE